MRELNQKSLTSIKEAISVLGSANNKSMPVRGSQAIGYYGANDKAYGRGDINLRLPIEAGVDRLAIDIVQDALLDQSPRIESCLSFNTGNDESILSMFPENKLNTTLFEKLKGFAVSSLNGSGGITAEEVIIKDKTKQLSSAISNALEDLKQKAFEIEHSMYAQGGDITDGRRFPSLSTFH